MEKSHGNQNPHQDGKSGLPETKQRTRNRKISLETKKQ